jgi:DNA-binding phage protein
VGLNIVELQHFTNKEPPMLNNITKKMNDLNQVLALYVSNIETTHGKKNLSQMAAENNLSHDELYRAQTFLSNKLTHLRPLLLSIGMGLARQKQGWLLADVTFISKKHSKCTEGAGRGYSGSTKEKENGLALIMIMWSDGRIKVPLAYEMFIPESVAGDQHVKTHDLVLRMIIPIAQKLGCFQFLADGAFSNEAVMKTLNEHYITFVMRFASNRVIKTKDGIGSSLKTHPAFHFDRNTRAISITAQWHGITVFVTASRQRDKKNNWEYRYLVSNRPNEQVPHIESYDKRWAVEVFFRSAKQDFGLADCQARSLARQLTHIAVVCFAFIKREKKNIEYSAKIKKVPKKYKIPAVPMHRRSIRSMNHAYA